MYIYIYIYIYENIHTCSDVKVHTAKTLEQYKHIHKAETCCGGLDARPAALLLLVSLSLYIYISIYIYIYIYIYTD